MAAAISAQDGSTESLRPPVFHREQHTRSQDRLTPVQQLIALSIGVVLGGVVSGLRDIFYVKVLAWLISFTITSRIRLISLLAHAILFRRSPDVRSLSLSLRRLFARHGADDEVAPNLGFHSLSVAAHLSTILLITNISAIFHFLQKWLVCLELITATVSLWWICVDRPWPTLLEETAKAAQLLIQISRRVLIASLKAIQIAYRHAVKPVLQGYQDWATRRAGSRRPLRYGAPYCYQDLGPGEIRLLQISRKWLFGEYSCHILHVALAQAPQYECISYTWGSSVLNEHLIVDDRSLPVTAHALKIIQDRASTWDTKYVWIDSVCINQSNLQEKSAQISLMQDIYRSARQTIIWLGHSPNATACISFLTRHMRTFILNPPNTDWKALFRIGSTETGWQEFLDFLDHPYWSRMWIVQEVALSRRPIISYGGENLSWDFLETFFRLMYERRVGSLFVLSETTIIPRVLQPAGVLQIPFIMQMRSNMAIATTGPYLRLPQVLTRLGQCKAQDPRDKVYGALGLLRDHRDHVIAPDYNKSITDVCIDVGKHCLQNDPIHAFAHAGIGFSCNDPALPSWCPNYCGPRLLSTLAVGSEDAKAHLKYCASGLTDFHSSLDHEQAGFVFDVLQFDSIAELGPLCHNPATSIGSDSSLTRLKMATQLLAMIRYARSALAAAQERDVSPQDDETVWRVLIGDRHMPRSLPAARPADPVYGRYFRAAEMIARVVCGEAATFDEDTNAELGRGINTRFSEAELGYGRYGSAAALAGCGKRVAMTSSGALCLVPELSQVGDRVGVIRGLQTCHVFRSDAQLTPGSVAVDHIALDVYRLVGESYVHGYMDGEALDKGRQWRATRVW